jgi:hypothetical protein
MWVRLPLPTIKLLYLMLINEADRHAYPTAHLPTGSIAVCPPSHLSEVISSADVAADLDTKTSNSIGSDAATSCRIRVGTHNVTTLRKRNAWQYYAYQVHTWGLALLGVLEARFRTDDITFTPVDNEGHGFFIAHSAADDAGNYGCALMISNQVTFAYVGKLHVTTQRTDIACFVFDAR